MGIEDLTLGQLQEALSLLSTLTETTMKHALVIVADPDHSCEMDNIEDDDAMDDMPEFSDYDVQVFLAYEQSCISVFGMVRQGLIKHGFDMLSEELGS